MAALRERLEAGFAVGDPGDGSLDWWPWGSTCFELAQALGRNIRRREAIAAPAPGAGVDLWGHPVVELRISGGPPERPVLRAVYEFELATKLGEPDVFGRWVDTLGLRLGVSATRGDDTLAPGVPPASTVATRAEFVLEGARLIAMRYGGPRRTGSSMVVASLWHEVDPVRAAQPYLNIFDARDAAWQRPGRELARLKVPSLLPETRMHGSAAALRVHHALHHPERRAPPGWLDSLAVDEISIWRAADTESEPWGTCSRFAGLVFDEPAPRLVHTRVLPARGRGGASLGVGGPFASMFTAGEGPAALDELVDRLCEFGAKVLVETYDDD